MSDVRRVATTAEALAEIRWTRSVSNPDQPMVLQQMWKVDEHYSDETEITRHEWRDVKIVPPVF